MSNDFDAIFSKHGARTGIDWRLLKALAMRESSLRPDAVNEEYDGPGGVASRGLMQVLCPQKLYVTDWCVDRPCAGGCDALFEPDLNVQVGADILAWNLKAYGFPRGVSVYNAASQANAAPQGPFTNQYYVDDVIDNLRALGGDPDALRRQFGNGSRGA